MSDTGYVTGGATQGTDNPAQGLPEANGCARRFLTSRGPVAASAARKPTVCNGAAWGCQRITVMPAFRCSALTKPASGAPKNVALVAVEGAVSDEVGTNTG